MGCEVLLRVGVRDSCGEEGELWMGPPREDRGGPGVPEQGEGGPSSDLRLARRGWGDGGGQQQGPLRRPGQ